jgi:pre-rRNA-processing protein TSR3
MFYEVIIDSGETPNKCTIAPLSFRTDFNLIRVKGEGPIGPLKSQVLLHHEGQCLTVIRNLMIQTQGIASIDCIWRRLDTIIGRVAGPLPILARIPDGFETAYPRRSKKNTDPAGGLATIEAIFVAAAILGKWDISLFSEYYFGSKFVEINKSKFLELGVHQATQENQFTKIFPPFRNSMQRKRDRGKVK